MQSSALRLRKLLQLRWLAIIIQAALALFGSLADGAATGWLAVLVAVGVFTNLGLSRAPARSWTAGAVILLDVGLLTGLLALIQGAFNPFTALYIVYVAIAASVLSARWTGAVVVVCAGAYATLFLGESSGPHGHMMQAHLWGMWLAFAVAAPFVAYTIASTTQALERERAHSAKADRLASLGTLAAGAAHELSTPLGTIAIASRELEARVPDAFTQDARLIRQEVERCTAILRRLSADLGQVTGAQVEAVPLRELVARAVVGLDEADDYVLELGSLGDWPAAVPVDPVARALRGLIDNGLDASPEDQPVWVQAHWAGDRVRLDVVDVGEGMTEATLARAGDPFFTTKGPDAGMGLGVFYARSVLEQVGGAFSLTSELGRGTTASVLLPAGGAS